MKSINRFFTLAGLITWAVLWTGCSNYENVSGMDTFTKDQAKMSFADLSANLKFVEFDRTYDAHHHGKDVHLSDILPQWNAAVMIEEANATLWEIPLISTYASVIVAGRLDGAYITPAEQPTQSRLLLRKDHATGEVECHMLTLVGENIAQTHINTLENLTGFAVISDPDGTPVQAYKITNGNREEILAGNAQLQHQDEDFYCFCFWKEDDVCKRVLTKSDTDYVDEYFCTLCMHEIEYCTCGRCSKCGFTPGSCVCHYCFICNRTQDQCTCKGTCDRCGEPQTQCTCPKTSNPVDPENPENPKKPGCPTCGKDHQGNCPLDPPTTTPTPTLCPYCGMGSCGCCPICGGTCYMCSKCHTEPCICNRPPVSTH